MDAIYKAIHQAAINYPGGMRKLAQDLNLQSGTFSNKCNPAMETHVVNVKEVVDICRQTDDLSPLFEIARALHCVCLPIEKYDDIADMHLLDAWSDWDIERGETKQEIKVALAQHKISQQQIDRIEREMFEDFQKELALLERLKTWAE